MTSSPRQPLVLLLVLAQIGCLTFGVVWAAQWLRRSYEQVVERDVAAQGQSIALEVARRAADLPPDSVEPGAQGWDSFQSLCEQVKVPRQGFVAIMRADTGALVCHTRLEQDPELLAQFPGQSLLVSDQKVTSILEATNADADKTEPVASGYVEESGELYNASCLAVPRLDVVVGVYQSARSVNQEVAQFVNPLVQAGFVLIASVVAGTALITSYIVRRYRRAVAAAHDSLDLEVQRRTQSLIRTRNAVIFGLAKLAESRDKDAGSHLERIRAYVTLLASEMARTNPEINHPYVANLAVASSLHDIGKVGVPDAVLLKPDRLSLPERRAMQMHASLGGECLAAIQRQLGDDDFLELAQQVAMAHHEQWDGSGYPHGLQGKSIPLPARIVALADVYDALTTNRPYRPALSHQEARDWIVSQYGAHFDPEVVEAFVAREKDFQKLSKLDDGSTARHAPAQTQAGARPEPVLR